MYNLQTSGTTGKPLKLWRSLSVDRAWYALYEARTRIWNGLGHRDRWAIVGGQLVAPYNQSKAPFWVWNAGMHQLYLSSYHLAPTYIPAYFRAIENYGITYILGYASSLYALAAVAIEQDLEVPRLRAAISNAEPFFEHQRRAVEDAFQCPTRDTFGMCEIVAAASECEHGIMHLWPEIGSVEVLDDGAPIAVAAGDVGRLICTGLLNDDMPLIRYEVGDRGSLATTWDACACGRTLPVLKSIEGRNDDVILTRDGRRIGRLDPVFKAGLPIIEAQVIQWNLDRVEVRFVPSRNYQTAHGEIIRKRLEQRIGGMEIVLRPVDQISRTANGKLRAVVSKLGESAQVHVG